MNNNETSQQQKIVLTEEAEQAAIEAATEAAVAGFDDHDQLMEGLRAAIAVLNGEEE